MTNTQTQNPLTWLSKLSDLLYKFQCEPSVESKAALLTSCTEYQAKVNEGLAVSKTIPEPIRRSNSLKEWYNRLLVEAMTMFRINPTEERLNSLSHQLDEFQNAVATGRIKP